MTNNYILIFIIVWKFYIKYFSTLFEYIFKFYLFEIHDYFYN